MLLLYNDRLNAWHDRLRSLVDLFAVLWFIVGNYLLFSSKTCSAQAPRLYYTSLAYVLIGYLMVIVPILLCTSAIFCLPCVLCKLLTSRVTGFKAKITLYSGYACLEYP